MLMTENYKSEFSKLLKEEHFKDAKYYVLIAATNRWESEFPSTPRVREIEDVIPSGKGVVCYAHILYVYSSFDEAKKRGDILGDVEPFELKCFSCFLKMISGYKDESGPIKVLPIADVILDEKWHVELFTCRSSQYNQITHAYLWDRTPELLLWSHDSDDPNIKQEQGFRYVLEGCTGHNDLRWERARSYYDPTFKSSLCRPVAYPTSSMIMLEDGMDFIGDILCMEEDLDVVIVNNRGSLNI